jgi:hypothetical protein
VEVPLQGGDLSLPEAKGHRFEGEVLLQEVNVRRPGVEVRFPEEIFHSLKQKVAALKEKFCFRKSMFAAMEWKFASPEGELPASGCMLSALKGELPSLKRKFTASK